MSGRIVHFELPYDDADRAQGFYSETFGWDVQSMPGFDYRFVSTGPQGQDGMPTEPGYIGGGMGPRQGALTGPVVTIDSADIDADLARVTAAGGTVVEGRTPVGDMGFTAYFTDTEGNVVGLWETARQG